MAGAIELNIYVWLNFGKAKMCLGWEAKLFTKNVSNLKPPKYILPLINKNIG